jgi:2-iminobutanoate/2-iminopropanoate deaminase
MKSVHTEHAPNPRGHYSQAIVHGDTIYVSGQLAVDPATGEKVLDSPGGQARQALANVAAVLAGAGASLKDVVKVTVYVSDIALWGEVNDVYAEVFGDHRPARAIVPTGAFHSGFVVEIEAVAAVPA